ncbi:MAG TPA: PAC2 family protein, partial [Nitrososphaeraceae archaeon]
MSKPIEIVFSEKKTPPLHSPHLICGFPGTGLVGKLAVDYLIKELGAIHMADLFSSYFSPQVVIQADGTTSIVKNSIYYVKNTSNSNKNKSSKIKKEIKEIGKPKVQLDQSINGDSPNTPPLPLSPHQQSTTSLNSITSGSLSSKDLILLTGDSQPVVPGSEYILSEQILDLITKFKISNIYSLASYVTGTFVNNPKIYGTATNQEIVKSFRSFNISTLDNGN